jgi:Peptidase S24-like
MNSPAAAVGKADSVKRDLAREQLRSSGTVRLRVMGRSMLPSIWPGDVLVVESVSGNDVLEGDIVLYGAGARFVAHRVVARDLDHSTIQTQGDAVGEADQPICHGDLMGRVAFILRDGKCMEPGRHLGLPERAAAALFRRSQTAARVVVGIHGMRQASRRNLPSRQTSNHRVVPCHS